MHAWLHTLARLVRAFFVMPRETCACGNLNTIAFSAPCVLFSPEFYRLSVMSFFPRSAAHNQCGLIPEVLWMDVLIGDYAYFERFARQYEWVYAHTHALKNDVYHLRALHTGARSSAAMIDGHDASAHHFFIRHRRSGEPVAASRLVLHCGQTGVGAVPVATVARLGEGAAGALQISELSTIHANMQHVADSESPPGVFDLAMYLGATALARLLFHDLLLVTLPVERFKQFRALGLQFEYAGELAGNAASAAHFYLDLRLDIRQSSPLYSWQQAISEQFAPWVNMPVLQESEG